MPARSCRGRPCGRRPRHGGIIERRSPTPAPLSGASTAPSTVPLSGTITIDGSSTVYPITELVAEEFQLANPGVQVPVAFSGTGGGFKKFCVGETDINDASRPIKAQDEAEGQGFVTKGG